MIDPFAESPIVIDGEELVGEYRDIAPAAWPPAVRANYHMVEVQALLGGPVTDDVRDAVRALGESSEQGFLIGIVRGMFSRGPRPGMDSVAFRTKRLQGRESYPTWGELEPSCTDSAQVKQARAIRSALLDSGIETGSLLFRTGELLTPGQYKALGLRLLFLLKELSETSFLPLSLAPSEVVGTAEHTSLEIEHGLALMQYVLELAQGLIDGTQTLGGPTCSACMLLVEFWWWLQWRSEYLVRGNVNGIGTELRYLGHGLVNLHLILDQADRWSQQCLWKHLAWALRNCEMAGFLTMRDILVRPADTTLASARRLVAEREKRAVEPARGRDVLAEATRDNLTQALQRGRAFIQGGGLLATVPRAVAAPQPTLVTGPAAATAPSAVRPLAPPGFTTPRPAPPGGTDVKVEGNQRTPDTPKSVTGPGETKTPVVKPARTRQQRAEARAEQSPGSQPVVHGTSVQPQVSKAPETQRTQVGVERVLNGVPEQWAQQKQTPGLYFCSSRVWQSTQAWGTYTVDRVGRAVAGASTWRKKLPAGIHWYRKVADTPSQAVQNTFYFRDGSSSKVQRVNSWAALERIVYAHGPAYIAGDRWGRPSGPSTWRRHRQRQRLRSRLRLGPPWWSPRERRRVKTDPGWPRTFPWQVGPLSTRF